MPIPAILVAWPLLLPAHPAPPAPASALPLALRQAGAADPSPGAPPARDGHGAAPGEPVDEIIVTGHRLPGSTGELPYRVTAIRSIGDDAPELPSDFGDALAEEPTISVQRTARGQASPFIRGFTGFRVLTLIDGVRLNQAIYRDGPNQYLSLIDPWMLESARVVHGPGSVLYGSDAVGGTMLLASRTATPTESGREVRGRLLARAASAESSIATRLESEVATPDLAVRIAGGARELDDFSAGRHEGLQPNTAHSEWNGDFSIAAPLTDTLDFTGMLQMHHQEDVPRTHATIHGSNWRGTNPGTDLERDLDQERELEWLRFGWRPEEARSVELLLSRHRLSEAEDRIPSNGRPQVQKFDDIAHGAALTWREETGIGAVSTGLDWTFETIDSDFIEYDTDGTVRSVRPRGAVADDSTYETVGVFLEDEIPLADATALTLGARYTGVEVDAEDVDPNPADATVIAPIHDDFSDVVGSARLHQRFGASASAFVGVSQAFRAPNLSDLTRFDVARSGEVEIPSPGLDPEEFLTFELGGEWRRGTVRTWGSVWTTIVDGMIVRFPTGAVDSSGNPIVTKDNSGDGRIAGFEMGTDVDLTREWVLGGSFAWVEGTIEQTIAPGVVADEPLDKCAPARGEVHLLWSPEALDSLECLARLRFADEQDRLSRSDEADTQRIPPGGTPGFTVLDLGLAWTATETLRIYIEAENVTDRDYRIHGSGSNEPGANLAFGVELRF